MAGSNPKITAEVTAVDHATQTLQNVAELSKRITRESNSALAASAADSHSNIAAQAEMASGRMTAVMSGLRSVAATTATSVAASFGAMSLKIVHSSMEVGAEFERQLTKMKAFTEATPENIAAIRKAADSEGAKLPGGPTANIAAARAAAMSGVPVASAEIAAQHGQMFAYETGQDPATGTEDLISHASMLQHIRDAQNKPIAVSHATPVQIEKGLTETQNLLIAVNKFAPGNMHDVYEGFKYAGPSAIGAHVTSGEVAAEYIQLAEHGIRGSEAGVALRAGYDRVAAPTAKARTTAAALGLDIDKFREIDYSKLDADNFMNGIASRIGHEKAEKARASAERAIATFKEDGDAKALNDRLTSAIQHTGAKTLADHVKAANLERDLISPLVSKIDLPGLIAALNDLKAGIGAFNGIFGSKMGGKLSVLDGARLQKDAATLDAAEKSDNYQKSIDEYQKSYTGKTDRAKGTLTGLEDQIFQANKPIIEKATEHATGLLEFLQQHPTGSTIAADAGAAAGAGFAGWMSWKTAQAILKIARPTVQAAAQAAPEIAFPVSAEAGAGVAGAGLLGAAATGLPLMIGAGGALALAYAHSRDKVAPYAGSDTMFPTPDQEMAPRTSDGRSLVGSEPPTQGPSIFSRLVDYVAKSIITPAEGATLPQLEALRKNAPSVFGSLPDKALFAGGLPSIAAPAEKSLMPSDHGAGFSDRIAAALADPKGSTSSPKDITVHGDVNGEATLMQTIKVDPSPLLLATVQGLQGALKMNLNGKLGQTMRGSNAAVPSVAPGLSTFRPTVTGR